METGLYIIFRLCPGFLANIMLTFVLEKCLFGVAARRRVHILRQSNTKRSRRKHQPYEFLEKLTKHLIHLTPQGKRERCRAKP